MPRDQFAALRPGETLPGIPSQAWNHFLAKTKPGGLGPVAGGRLIDTGVEFRVLNTTASAVPRFGILQPNAPLNVYSATNDAFFGEDVLKGVAPAALAPFVVFQERVAANGVGRARVVGITKAKLNVAASGDTHASPSTSTSELSTGTSGPAKILWKESGTGAGKWGVVLLMGEAAPEAAPGPQVVATLTGSDTISFASGSDTGGLYSQASISGEGLYLIYNMVTGYLDMSPANVFGTVNFELSGITAGSGLTLWGFNEAVYAAGGIKTIQGSVGHSALALVESPSTGLPGFNFDWVGTTATGTDAGLGSISTSGYIVRL